LIEVTPLFAAGVSSAKIRVELAPGTTFKDRLVGGTLFVDVVRTAAVEVSPTEAPVAKIVKATPERKPPRKRVIPPAPAPKRRPAVAKAPKPAPKPVRIERKPAPVAPRYGAKPLPPSSDDESLMKDLGLEESAAAPSAPEEVAPPPPPPPPPPKVAEPKAPVPAPASEKEEPLDMDQLFGAAPAPAPEQPSMAEPPPAPPEEVAMVQPPSSEKFDSEKIAKNLPSISDLSVLSEGGVTTARIKRDAKTKYQVFKLVNPNRIVVDFLDATNQLQKSYSGFPGTKVQRVTTQQFVGPEGTISRVTFYLSSKPNYQVDKKGDAFILRLP
jgi:hypothetical protein